MDLNKILLKLRAVTGVEGTDIDAIAEYVSEQNKSINSLQVKALEREKELKRQSQQTLLATKIAEMGLDKDAFSAFTSNGLLDVEKFKFDDKGGLLYGDKLFSDHVASIPYLKKAMTVEVSKPDESKPDETKPTDPAPAPTPAPNMGTTNNGKPDTSPVETLIKDGLFAVPTK